MNDDWQEKPIQHSVKLSDEAWAATLERAELEYTIASEICSRLLQHYLSLAENHPVTQYRATLSHENVQFISTDWFGPLPKFKKYTNNAL